MPTYIFSITDLETDQELERLAITAENQELAEEQADMNMAARSMWFVHRELVETHENPEQGGPTL
jgi:hypothetical protein